MDGGGCFRANFGVERDGVSLLAEDGSFPRAAELTTGYPEFDHVLLKKLGWWDELTDEEKKAAEGKNWKTDLSGGIQRVVDEAWCHPFGNAKARAVVWNFPDGIPQHREPLYSARVPISSPSIRRTTTRRRSGVCQRCSRPCSRRTSRTRSKKYPLIMTSGRLVEYEGGGEETRSNPWLAELQQEMFVEINPKDANDRGMTRWRIRVGEIADRCAAQGQRMVTERVGREPPSCRSIFPVGGRARTCSISTLKVPHPIVRGEAVNTGDDLWL